MRYFKIKNLEKYQAGSDNKHWIKLWKKIRTDWAINQLTDSQKWCYIELVMLATDCGNKIPYDDHWLAKMLAKRLRDGRRDIKKMLDFGLLEPFCMQNGQQKPVENPDLSLQSHNISPHKRREDKIIKEKNESLLKKGKEELRSFLKEKKIIKSI